MIASSIFASIKRQIISPRGESLRAPRSISDMRACAQLAANPINKPNSVWLNPSAFLSAKISYLSMIKFNAKIAYLQEIKKIIFRKKGCFDGLWKTQKSILSGDIFKKRLNALKYVVVSIAISFFMKKYPKYAILAYNHKGYDFLRA